MASPCTNDPNEVISAVVGIQTVEENFERELDDAVDTATENADKFNAFVNGSDTQTVQLGEGAATPTIRNTVRQMMSAASELPNTDVSGKSATANGGSAMRTLAERFGDFVNVKDFGAKGDGVTDDTAAFEAAAATGRDIFVPKGTYNVSKSVAGNFYSHEEVQFANAVVEILCTSFLNEYKRKAVRFVVDFKFPGYNTALAFAQTNHPSSNITYLYPQACCHGVKNGVERLYVLYCAGSNSVATNFLAIYNLTTNEYEKYYVLDDSYSGEGLIYFDNGSEEYIYAPSRKDDKRKARYTLSGDSGAVLSATIDDFCSTKGGAPFFSRSDYGEWMVYGGDNQTYGTVSGITIYNDDAQYQAQIAWDKWDFDTLANYSSADPDQMGIPHKQGLFYDSGNLYIFAGGSGNSSNVGNVSDIGVIQKGFDGYTKRTSVCKSEKIKPILQSIFGKAVKYTENESGYVYKGKIYSLDVVSFTDNTEKIFLLEEFSCSANSVDFSSAMASSSNTVHFSARRYFPKSSDGTFKNPFTNIQITSLNDFLSMVARYGIEELAVDLFGSSIAPSLTLTSSGTTSTYTFSDAETYNPFNIVFRYQTKTTIFFTFYKRAKASEYVIYLNEDYSPREVICLETRCSGLEFFGVSNYKCKAVFNGQTYPTGIIFAYNNTLGNNLQFGGGAEASPQAFQFTISTANAGEDSSGSYRSLIFLGSSFRPNANNMIDLGIGDYRWRNLYLNASAVVTSDERLKTEVSDIDERVFKAWGKVRYKFFKYIDSVKEKGSDKARVHSGVIAQDVKEAFDSEGVDANKYGFFCYDEWDDRYEERPKIGSEDEFGNVKMERVLERKAGNMYSIRYEEALVLECAYQRWLGEKRDARIAALEVRLNELSGKSSAPSGDSTDNL